MLSAPRPSASKARCKIVFAVRVLNFLDRLVPLLVTIGGSGQSSLRDGLLVVVHQVLEHVDDFALLLRRHLLSMVVQ